MDKLTTTLEELLNDGIEGTFEPNEYGKEKIATALSAILTAIRIEVEGLKKTDKDFAGSSVYRVYNDSIDDVLERLK